MDQIQQTAKLGMQGGF